MINIKRAYWKIKDDICEILGEHEITTILLEQDGIYFDPSEDDFLDVIFKEYLKNYLTKEKISLELSDEDIFFYAKNANIYLLNYIYHDFFPHKKKNPFYPILEDFEEKGKINLGLFNGLEDQVVFLIEILEKMDISFKTIVNKYMLVSFPQSLECYKEDNVYGVRYEEQKFN